MTTDKSKNEQELRHRIENSLEDGYYLSKKNFNYYEVTS